MMIASYRFSGGRLTELGIAIDTVLMFLQLIIFLLQQQYVKLNYRYKKKSVKAHMVCFEYVLILYTHTDIRCGD